MKFCSKCGKEMVDEAIVCPNCGCAVVAPANTAVDDAPSTGYAVLGFFIPIVGLILQLINKDKSPKKARSAGKGALIGFIVGIVFSIIYGVILGSMLSSLMFF